MAKLVYQSGQPALRTDYLGGFQYEGDSLRFFPHAAGRVLRFVRVDAAGQATVRYEREYSLKDHLGNLRLAYRLGHVRRDSASLEPDIPTHARESQQFDSLSVSAPIAQNVGSGIAKSGSYVAKLNAGGNAPQPLGPLRQLAVQKGDTVTVSAYGLYPTALRNTFWYSLASFITGLFHPAPGAPVGPDPTRGRAGLPLLQVGVAAGLSYLPQLSGGVPRGYLRVLVFNADSALVSQQVQPLSSAALNNYERLRLRVLVPQDGYVSAFVGNESDVDVLFDDVTVELRQGVQVQETQYDPTGLEMAGLTGTTPGLKSLSQYKFNGKEFQTDLGLNWNHQDWRFFDTQLGRWHVVDPEIENGQESWTPYSFGFDNAVRYADADGRYPGGGDGAAALAVPALIAAAEVAGEVLVVGAAVVSSPVVLTVAAVAAVAVGVVALGYGASVLADHLPAMSPGFRIGAHNAAIYGSIYGVGDGNPGIYNASSGKRPANRTADRENGNSKASEKQQHGYKIKNNETNQTEEFGISGQKLKKDGTSPRVDQKLAQKYNNDPKYSGEVVKPKIQGGGGQTARERALDWEQGKVNSHSRSPSNPQPNAQNGPPNQILPKPKM